MTFFIACVRDFLRVRFIEPSDVGRGAITQLISGFLASVRHLRFTSPRIHRRAEEDAAFAEFSGESTVVSDGRRYVNDYAFYLPPAEGSPLRGNTSMRCSP